MMFEILSVVVFWIGIAIAEAMEPKMTFAPETSAQERESILRRWRNHKRTGLIVCTALVFVLSSNMNVSLSW